MNPFHLAMPVVDLESTRSFYGGLMGCREAVPHPHGSITTSSGTIVFSCATQQRSHGRNRWMAMPSPSLILA